MATEAVTGEVVERDHGELAIRAGDRLVPIAGALPGERVRVRIHGGGRAARAEVLAVERASAERVASACAAFPNCAGCDDLHRRRDAAVTGWLDRARSALLGAGLPADVELAHAAASPLGERDELYARLARRDGGPTGLFSTRWGPGRAIGECPAQRAGNVAALHAVLAAARAHGVEAADGGRGALESIRVRYGHGTGERQVALFTSTARLPHGQRLAEAAGHAGATALCLVVARERGTAADTIPLLGRARLHTEIAGLRFGLSPTTPIPQSAPAAAALAAALVRATGAGEGTAITVWRARGGVLALPLARAGASVTSFENDRVAAGDAEASAHDAGLAIRVGTGAPAPAPRRPAAVVVGLPRRPLGPDDARLLARGLRSGRLVLLTSDPGALAAAARAFAMNGYRLRRVEAFESRPLDARLELLATLVLD